MGFSVTELLIVLAIVALLFGTKKLRNIGGDLGSAIKGFRSAMNENDDKELNSPEKRDKPGGGQVIEGEVEQKPADKQHEA